jgi:hypothetical protein
MNLSHKMPSDLRLVVPATVEEIEVWMAETNISQQDLYRVAAASRLEVLPNQVTQTQRSLMKVTLMSTIYSP